MTPKAAYSRLIRTLSPYKEEDGPYIDLITLIRYLPELRWDLALLGMTASRKEHIQRRLPILGRTYQNARIYVLIHSLKSWLEHYNKLPVDNIIKDLLIQQKRYEYERRLHRTP